MDLNTIVNLVITCVMGIIGFFLKRSFTRLDNCAGKTELEECQKEIKSLSERFATKEELTEIKMRMEKLENGIDFLKENTIRKNDFVREVAGLSGKIDDMMGYLRGR